MPFTPPGEGVGFLVADVSRLMRHSFNRRAQEIGLSQAQCKALARLARRQGINQVTLAESLEVQPITLARTIDRLQQAGLVTREPDPADRRAVRLYLTDAAEPYLQRIFALAGETLAEATAGLPDSTIRLLGEALQHIKTNLVAAEGRGCEAREPVEG